MNTWHPWPGTCSGSTGDEGVGEAGGRGGGDEGGGSGGAAAESCFAYYLHEVLVVS